jgi:hypothetical protein
MTMHQVRCSARLWSNSRCLAVYGFCGGCGRGLSALAQVTPQLPHSRGRRWTCSALMMMTHQVGFGVAGVREVMLLCSFGLCWLCSWPRLASLSAVSFKQRSSHKGGVHIATASFLWCIVIEAVVEDRSNHEASYVATSCNVHASIVGCSLVEGLQQTLRSSCFCRT